MIVIVGYHGTLKKNAKQIVDTQKFYKSTKRTEWLGKGVYFYQYIYHAWQWADDQVRKEEHKSGDSAAVLKADICIQNDHIFDLDDPAQKKELDLFFKEVLEYSQEARAIKREGKDFDHKRKCLACNLYCQANTTIQMITYTFRGRQSKANPHQEVYPQTEKQLCVKDTSIIKNIKEVDRDGKEIN